MTSLTKLHKVSPHYCLCSAEVWKVWKEHKFYVYETYFCPPQHLSVLRDHCTTQRWLPTVPGDGDVSPLSLEMASLRCGEGSSGTQTSGSPLRG